MAATGEIAGIAADGGDPRAPQYQEGPIPPSNRLLHDPKVSFYEYTFYASLTRQEEEESFRTNPPTVGLMQVLFPTKSSGGVTPIDPHEKKVGEPQQRIEISEAEWTNASRAVRTASGSACFYLITTDILGPFGVGFSMGCLGWGPGIGLFTLFGLLAGYSGWLLWTVFLGVDSYQFPAKNYGDLAFRAWGRPLRHVVNFLQALQLLISVGVIVISNGQALSQISKFRLCYAVCCLIWAIAGFVIGQVRTLQKFGILANAAVFLNLLIMFITMGVFAHSPPNYPISVLGSAGGVVNPDTITPSNATGVNPPIIHYNGMPSKDLTVGIFGLMQGVYAYAGAQLFVEFMAELRRPRDFLKAMWGAQFFIYSCYMIYGCYTYFWQGQYSYQISYQGVSPYSWQTVGNVLAVISGLIAAALYGNIGIKVIYNNLLMEWFHAPALITKRGKILWSCIVPIYWIIAFILAASIPDFFGLTGITAAVCFVQFTYTFPPMIALGYRIQKHALQEGEGFDPATGIVTLHDHGIKRLVRGFFADKWYLNVLHVLYVMGALSISGLGAYSSIEQLISAFKIPQLNAFSCTSPLNLNG
ncbi:transmembrane amino acid transporter protein [Stipitochalara longipes BDJ]|nr:transmembrane amino acid transporter protein [Stipitochalara longipes BDJ]